ncbi:MAG: DNA (cytosine-5-)-methyltransferase [Methanomassiliicoccus sp.]|nr:MAG: DNA (cytosine-5-)-methyltransferase [Methanomassiliicoccus sp.]
MSEVHAIDLFCGVGGLTCGLRKSGINVIAGIDIDPYSRYPYEKNNSSRFIEADVRSIRGKDLLKLYPEGSIRMLAGCAPCQPFSNLSNKVKDRSKSEKWNLLGEFSRLIRETDPHLVTMENVPQLIKAEPFADFIAELKRKGYHVKYSDRYCPDYGLPQTRKRLVLLASKFGEINDDFHKTAHEATVKDAIGELEEIEAGGGSEKDPFHRAQKLSEINLRRIRGSKSGGTWRDWDPSLRTICHGKKKGMTYPSVYGRMSWEAPSPTITTQFYNYGSGRFGHPSQDRALSIREGAILQTFPSDYEFLSPGALFSFKKLGILIGNAVPVRLGELIGDSMIKHVEIC